MSSSISVTDFHHNVIKGKLMKWTCPECKETYRILIPIENWSPSDKECPICGYQMDGFEKHHPIELESADVVVCEELENDHEVEQ